MYDYIWRVVRSLMVDLASGVPAWASFTLFRSALGQTETGVQYRRFVRFAAAIVLGALAVLLFFVLHRQWG
jgi:hypothetical protein